MAIGHGSASEHRNDRACSSRRRRGCRYRVAGGAAGGTNAAPAIRDLPTVRTASCAKVTPEKRNASVTLGGDGRVLD